VKGHLYVLPVGGPDIILDEMPMWGGKNPEGPPAYHTPAFMLATDNIKDTYRFMKQQGAELVTGIEDDRWFVFRDPDGNLLMICESVS
jgi:hypothetical protein